MDVKCASHSQRIVEFNAPVIGTAIDAQTEHPASLYEIADNIYRTSFGDNSAGIVDSAIETDRPAIDGLRQPLIVERRINRDRSTTDIGGEDALIDECRILRTVKAAVLPTQRDSAAQRQRCPAVV